MRAFGLSSIRACVCGVLSPYTLPPQLSQLQVRYEMVSRLVDPSLDLTKALDGEKETLSVRACVRGGGGVAGWLSGFLL